MSCWAPLVPFAQSRLGVDNSIIGWLLLCLGSGSVSAMMLTGSLSARHGSRPIILLSCLSLSLVLPLLTLASTLVTLGAALLIFGAALGSLDVAMNVHALEVERASNRPLMSGFHGLYSLGGVMGSLVMTFLLSLHVKASSATLLCSGLMMMATVVSAPFFLRQTVIQTGSMSVMPCGIVKLLALLAGICFLTEGAVLDWGALLLTQAGLVTLAHGGLGYMLFSIAMTIGRLCGDFAVARIGDRATLIWGSLLTMAGVVLTVNAPTATLALLGFLLIGFGASNLVPVLFRGAGTQRAMPPALAVSAISLVGYAGVLLGPAGIGLIARFTGLPAAFGLLAALMGVVTLSARAVAPGRSGH